MSKHTTALIDADILAYKAAAFSQQKVDWGDGDVSIKTDMDKAISFIEDTTKEWADKVAVPSKHRSVVMVLSGSNNFRKQVWSGYKSNRKGQEKPLLLQKCRDYIKDVFMHMEVDHLEADDVMGIYSTGKLFDGKTVIVSEDKDMFTVPGLLLNPVKHDAPIQVTAEDADWFHLYQTLIGDSTDGYGGCPKMGKVKATKLLTYAGSLAHAWQLIVAEYEDAGLTEKDALVQARLARILRYSDIVDEFNFEVKLWSPKYND